MYMYGAMGCTQSTEQQRQRPQANNGAVVWKLGSGLSLTGGRPVAVEWTLSRRDLDSRRDGEAEDRNERCCGDFTELYRVCLVHFLAKPG